ncbi:MAG: pantoate--beta-alanine ligase [Acidobacteria bacterium RIFCSPLOWO2_02_FULL_68_18]|nr:MAG: pantoate--beta-alanine ligase [Acidobacteria bacterium RIFCSPLOWO2_02_FULL_68_18]OFW50755.1 MAG: pantoate--beta-alanine ligase [Acidobacteria bacterium RIFCSPLOWO2_12_FULL_68_19]
MDVIDAVAPLRDRVAAARRASRRVGFVPTMGALHLGHARLIERARRECDCVVVSIFVNPLQFDRPEDLRHYPRTLPADFEMCARLGVDVAFAPGTAEMYPADPSCTIQVGRVASHLCGRHRPGHFAGVATVVMKLFQIVQPDRAYFGEKDAQQLAVIRHLVRDFNVPVQVEAVATVREPDGLALSSRNQRLNAEERRLAPALYRALCEARRSVAEGTTDPEPVRRAAVAAVPRHEGLRLEYLELVEPDTMQPVESIDGPVLAAGALWVGSTRLIDNLTCDPPGTGAPAGPVRE